MKVVVFDFDGTITTRDTFIEFISYAKGLVPLCVALFMYLPWLVAYKFGLYPNWKIKQRLFGHFFKGMSLDDFNKSCAGFFKKKGLSLIRPKARIAVSDRLKECDKVLIASASIHNWIKPFADDLGIKVVLSTEAEVDDRGILTGRFKNKNCHGAEKVARLQMEVPCLESCYLIVYGDSKGDRQLLECANEAYYRTL